MGENQLGQAEITIFAARGVREKLDLGRRWQISMTI